MMEFGNRDHPIFNVKLAGYLITRGFEVSNIQPHKEHSDKFVFYFKKCSELLKEMQIYVTQNKK
jgi:hypothetical protein